MDKYTKLVKQANDFLRKSKACSMCKNATETIDRDYFKVNYYCNIYNKNVTRHCELMCEHYVEK